MAFAYAGQYGPETILDQTSKEVANTPVTVYQSNGSTLATLYTDETMAASAANPVTTDTLGNLVFFATPGRYVLAFSIAGVATTRTVVVREDPADAAAVQTQIGIFGVGAPVVGNSPPDGFTEFKQQCGNATLSFASGSATLPFPVAFPTGVLSVQLTVENSSTANVVVISAGNYTLTGCEVVLFLNGAPFTGSVQFTYVAIGW